MIIKAPPSNYINYNAAVLYCAFCNHDGRTDWKMPTRFESRRYRLYGWVVEDNNTFNMLSTVTPIREV
jgi:hypothetical protein